MFFDTPNTVLDVLIGAWRARLLTYEEHGGTRTWRRWRERLTIALDDDWLFFDTPNIVLDVLIGGGERSLLTYEEH